jgi:hypothetical protein
MIFIDTNGEVFRDAAERTHVRSAIQRFLRSAKRGAQFLSEKHRLSGSAVSPEVFQ